MMPAAARSAVACPASSGEPGKVDSAITKPWNAPARFMGTASIDRTPQPRSTSRSTAQSSGRWSTEVTCTSSNCANRRTTQEPSMRKDSGSGPVGAVASAAHSERSTTRGPSACHSESRVIHSSPDSRAIASSSASAKSSRSASAKIEASRTMRSSPRSRSIIPTRCSYRSSSGRSVRTNAPRGWASAPVTESYRSGTYVPAASRTRCTSPRGVPGRFAQRTTDSSASSSSSGCRKSARFLPTTRSGSWPSRVRRAGLAKVMVPSASQATMASSTCARIRLRSVRPRWMPRPPPGSSSSAFAIAPSFRLSAQEQG